MIRRSFTSIGRTAMFFIGTDKALKRFIESIDFDAPVRRHPAAPDPWSPEERAKRDRKQYHRPLWLKAEKHLDAWLRRR